MDRIDNLSNKRVYFRTLGLLLLFTIILVNYKNSIQPISAISLANTMTNIDSDQFLSRGLIFDVLYFIFVILSIHCLWALIITISAQINSASSTLNKDLTWFSIFLLHITFSIGINSYYFTTSLTSYLRESILSTPTFLVTALVLIIYLFINALVRTFKTRYLILLCTFTAFTFTYPFIISSSAKRLNLESKDIIIIGIDGLRPDHLEYEGADKSLAPFINTIVNQSFLYKNTYTPLGRTYVAWMSVLTGQYPVNNKVRFNLAPPEYTTSPLPLTNLLRKEGYISTYAIDERRFNQIDLNYGFDNLVGPKIGAADALLSSLADLPYVNILLKHPYSKYLFPYQYGNRAYGKAYDPEVFNNDIINNLNFKKPNFLAVHYCLLHWPYSSKNFIQKNSDSWDGNYNHFMYKEMLKKVDQQVADLFNKLKSSGMLENSVIYMLSDHGESFKLKKDNHQKENLITELPSQKSWGHGTNILDQEQSRVLLAKLRFKNNKIVNKKLKFNDLYSLVDILPSINKDLGSPIVDTTKFDGYILPNTIPVKEKTNNERFLFVESSLPVKSINKSFIDKDDVLSETSSYYEVKSNGQAYMRFDDYNRLIANKQRSIYFRDLQLTMSPDYEDLIIYNRNTNTVESESSFIEKDLIIKPLKLLCEHYKGDVGFDPYNKCEIESNILIDEEK
ncbi:sulfatase [Shewanella sp. GutCb]|uniref:sulfatase-like hydrolase/transferase n=1 Tax=Shewanella sp. GutCb TaxID=2058315 RepID=UPI000C7E5364|nr:sulfatase-like hydrolase/transferase [Shewanella sp. GutCb]PKG73791.1 sulfatase [Shewanella sp. GutCb]